MTLVPLLPAPGCKVTTPFAHVLRPVVIPWSIVSVLPVADIRLSRPEQAKVVPE